MYYKFFSNSIEIRLLTALEWPSFFFEENRRYQSAQVLVQCYLSLDSLSRSVYRITRVGYLTQRSIKRLVWTNFKKIPSTNNLLIPIITFHFDRYRYYYFCQMHEKL